MRIFYALIDRNSDLAFYKNYLNLIESDSIKAINIPISYNALEQKNTLKMYNLN